MKDNLRLDGQYQIKIMKFWYLYLIVYGVFFGLYLDYIMELMVGGFVFVYFILVLVIGARYYRELLKMLLSTLFEIDGQIYLKTIHPTYVPKYRMDYKKVMIFELLPLVDVFLTYGLAGFIFKDNPYMLHVIIGAMLLSLCILTRNLFYTFIAIQNREGVFEYTRDTLKVYKEIPEGYMNQFDYQGKDLRKSEFDKDMYK